MAWIWADIRRSSSTREIYQTLLPMLVSRRILTKDKFFTTLDEEGRYENIMSRIHLTSKWGNIPRERVDSWKHEDRPNPGGDGLLSSRRLRCGDQDRILVSWQNLFLGSYREWNQQIRNRTSEEILAVLGREVHGNLLRRPDHDWHRPWRCLLYLFRVTSESG